MEPGLLELMRRGDVEGALVALTDPPDAAARRAVRTLRERMLASPIGHRGPAWLGALTEDHVVEAAGRRALGIESTM